MLPSGPAPPQRPELRPAFATMSAPTRGRTKTCSYDRCHLDRPRNGQTRCIANATLIDGASSSVPHSSGLRLTNRVLREKSSQSVGSPRIKSPVPIEEQKKCCGSDTEMRHQRGFCGASPSSNVRDSPRAEASELPEAALRCVRRAGPGEGNRFACRNVDNRLAGWLGSPRCVLGCLSVIRSKCR